MAEEYKIIPNISVGPIHIQMHRNKCESLLGEASDSFKRIIEEKETTYVYKNDSIQIVFDEENKVNEISLFPPNKVQLNNIQLLERHANDIYSELTNSGIVLEKIEIGMHCKNLGVILVEIEELIDGVQFFKENMA